MTTSSTTKSGLQLLRTVTTTSPAKMISEDRVLYSSDGVGVFDGATGLVSGAETGYQDANWLLSQVFFHLGGAEGDTFIDKLSAAVKKVGENYDRPDHAPHTIPSSGMVFIEPAGGGLYSFYQLADCQAYIVRRDGSTEKVFKPDVLEQLDQIAIREMSENIRKTGDVAKARELTLPTIRKNRSRANTPTGYHTLTPNDDPWIFATRRDMKLKSGDRVLLASDGFYALFESYGLETVASAVSKLENGDPEELIRSLRQFEDEDALLSKAPRTKQYDDATAVLLKIA
ncbi:protein phosphatase 2C domain-containing protein [Sulfitobacter sp. R18_1]|uniref:protein phosphatase 2C domain-containing protein n=1 Tax=Sulfitobacter sp. R18_1 TaxID=2821104 RepID=UPI001ADB8B94|nr:protein phosphatase 2C domain-containing protein [Sulfitobacter sp. R18_1]MBO9428013.1 protein phosphatase 2C domain-containing protein [Sulfitobacter sp. R18_1]